MPTRSLIHGVYGSLIGGVIFGAMMGMLGMLPMVASMAGSQSAMVGFLIHMVISAIIGAGFVVAVTALGREGTAGAGAGLAYGFVWWVLGPLTLMPLGMGMGLGVNWTVAAAAAAAPSLVGHLIFGGVLGATYHRLQSRAGEAAPAHVTSPA